MKKTYNIKQTSVFLWIFSLMASIFAGTGLMILIIKVTGFIPKDQPIFIILLVAPIIFFAFKVPNYTAAVDIELTIDNEGLKKKWLRQFFFQNRRDSNINWIEIKDFVFEPDRQFDKFKLTLKDGTKFKFHHNTDHDNKDDFQQFRFDFENKIAKINRDKTNDIKRGKTIYETVWGLILAVIGIIMLIVIIVTFLFFPIKKSTNYAMLGASAIGTIYFIFQVYDHRKKNKNE